MTVTTSPPRPTLPRALATSAWYRSTPLLVAVLAVSFGLTTAWTVWSLVVSPTGFVDFNVYRLGVQAWWHGNDIYGPLPPTRVGLELPFIYPPFSTIAFSPLTVLPWFASVVEMMLLSLASLAVVLYLAVRRAWRSGGRRGALVVAAALFPFALILEPIRYTLWFGQINLVLMALVALDCLVVAPKWPRGVLVGIAAAIKLTPGVFLLYFLLRKDYRAAAWCAISGAVTTAIGFAVNWKGSWTYFLGDDSGLHVQGGSPFAANQSIWSLVHRFGAAGSDGKLAYLLVLAAMLVVTIVCLIRARGSAPLAMAITGGFGLLASPTSWGHHWVYCVPGILMMIVYAVRKRHIGWGLAALVAIGLYGTGPFQYLPVRGGLPHLWDPWQKLIGNGFTIACIVFLVLYAAPAVVGRFRALRPPSQR